MVNGSPPVTILNVDDHEISRYAKSRMLRQAGYEVKEAATGNETLQVVRQERPSLVLLDVHLPDINGLEVCRRIKGDPTLASTLVLQISASLVSPADKARGLEGGADAYLAEPVEPAELVASVKALLRLREAESALETERTFLRQVIDLNPNFIFAKDREGRFTLVNQAVAEAYGTTVEGLIGKTDADFSANPAEVDHFRADDLQVMDSLQEKFISEETITDAAGQTRWLQTIKRPIIGEDGLAHQVLGVSTDITLRKQAQAELMQLNETLEQRVSERTALIQLLHEIAAAANESKSVEEALKFAIERICAYTGWPVGHVYELPAKGAGELIPTSIWYLENPSQLAAFRQFTEITRLPVGVGLPGQVLASGQLVWLDDVTQAANFPRAQAAAQSGLKTGFGFPVWAGQEIVAVLEFYAPEIVEPDGAFLEAVNQIGTQLGRVVERARSEKQIRERERQLAEAQQIAHLGSWQWDIATNKVSWSDALYRIYGVEPDREITYEYFLELVHPNDRDYTAGVIAAAYQSGQPFDFEHRVVRPDGVVRMLHAQGRVILAETGRPVKMVGTGHDITERKEMEDQLRRLNVELEQRVNERTAQLEAANQELADEIDERKQVEAALRQSETQLQLITNAVPALISYIDADLRYRFNNRTYENWFGLPVAEIAGRQVRDVLGGAAYEALRPHFEAALAGQQVNYEQLAPYQSGARHIQATYTPDLDEEGHVRGIVVLVNDISERKRMEEALRESEERFRAMADTAPVMIWVTEPDGACSYRSKSWYQFTGLTPEANFGPGCAGDIHPHDREVVDRTFRAAGEIGEPFQLEYRLRHIDGSYRWVMDSASPRRGPQGEFLGYIGSIIDIHERKRAELGERLLAEAGKVLAVSPEPAVGLSSVAQLAVPYLADWCAVMIFEEDWSVRHSAVAHVDPAKVEMAYEMQRRYPPQREVLAQLAQPWQQGQSELYPEITEAMLEASARDAEHYQYMRDSNMQSAMVVPLVVQERVIGFVLLVWAESGNRYDEQDLALAEELARRAAIALERARLYEVEQQARQAAEATAERIASLQILTSALSVALTREEVVEVIIEQGITALDASGGVVMLVSEDKTSLTVIRAIGYSEEFIKAIQDFPLVGASPGTDTVRLGQPIWIKSQQEFIALYPELGAIRGATSQNEAVALLPLRGKEQVLGALKLSFREELEFTPEDKDFMITLANQCAQALERAYLYEAESRARTEAEIARERLSLLAAASETLIASPDYQTRLVNLAHLVVPRLADWCVVDVIGEDKLIHRLAVIHADPARAELAAQLRAHYPVIDWQSNHTIVKILRQGRSWFDPEVSEARFVAEARDAEHLRLLQGLGFASEMVIPLIAQGRALGTLTFVRTAVERRYEPADLALAEELARRAAIAIDNARLYQAEQQARQSAEETAERIAGLQAITAALSEALTPAQVAQVVINQGLSALAADGGAVILPHESPGYLKAVANFGYPAGLVELWQHFPLSLHEGPISDAILTDQPIFITSAVELLDQYPSLQEQKISNHQAWVALPLEVEERAVGAIVLSFAEARTYSEEERAFMITLAQQCAQALERARLYEVEQRARLEAEATQQRLALLAEMRERNRLAQELHDTVAQALGYLNLKIGQTHALLAGDEIQAATINLQELKNVVGETYTDVREEIFNLRSKVFSGLSFMEVLDRYVDKYRRFYHLDIQLIQETDPALFEFPAEVTPQIVRTIQEALINIRKHAQVDRAIIRLSQENASIYISVEDQGQGFDPAKIQGKASSFGLQIMRERMESVGGSLEINTIPGQGTQVILRYRKE